MERSKYTPLSLFWGLLATAILLVGCGSQNDYELFWMRELIGRGDADAALAHYPQLPEELKRTAEVRELYLGARLVNIGISTGSITVLLGPMLADPLETFQGLPENALTEAHLLELVELALGNPRAMASREPYFLLSSFGALLGSLSLCRDGRESGPPLFIRTCEYIAACDEAKYGDYVRAAHTLLEQLDALGDDRNKSAATMFGVAQ